MLDITFKQTDNDLYELKAQFGKDVDPDALLASISSLLEMVRKTFPPSNQPTATTARSTKKSRTTDRPSDASGIIAAMPEASKAVLVSLFEYQQAYGKPIVEVRDIIEHAEKFSTYKDFMEGKDREQEVQALRYQIRLLRDKGLIQSPPDRSLSVVGVEAAKQLKPNLDVLESPEPTADSLRRLQEQSLSEDVFAEESDQNSTSELSNLRLPFERS